MEIAVDFDGTCVTHEFPKVGKNIGAEKVLRMLVENKHNLILFTMRSDKDKIEHNDPTLVQATPQRYLQMAVDWFKSHGIPLYGIQ